MADADEFGSYTIIFYVIKLLNQYIGEGYGTNVTLLTCWRYPWSITNTQQRIKTAPLRSLGDILAKLDWYP